jgi:hypothetical protein
MKRNRTANDGTGVEMCVRCAHRKYMHIVFVKDGEGIPHIEDGPCTVGRGEGCTCKAFLSRHEEER